MKPKPLPQVMYPRIAGVVIAAGFSRRFGVENKLLHPISGVPLVARVVDAFAELGLGRLVVVVGHEADQVRRVLADRQVETVINERYAEGMGTSIAKGVSSLIPEDFFDGALVCVGDLPDLSSTDIGKVCAVFGRNADRVVVPRFEGRRGHPVCFPRAAFRELAELDGDTGGREVIQRDGPPVFVDDVSQGCVRDLDAP